MTARRATRWTALGAAVLSLAVTGYLAYRIAPAEDHSAQAGREYGESQALMYNQHMTQEPSDQQIRLWCREGADLSADTQVWYRGGVIQVGELDRNRFADGCFETYRAATR